MQSIHIDTNTIKLAVNDDPEKVIEFNPDDIGFIERYYNIMGDLEEKRQELEKKILELPKVSDSESIEAEGYKQSGQRIVLTKDICQFMRGRIDYVFGEGTSQKAFEDINTLNMFSQLFEGITPFIERSRNKKVGKYKVNSQSKVMR